MAIKLRQNLKTVTHEFTVKLNPIIFRNQVEIHAVNIGRNVYDDKCPSPGDDSEYESFSGRIKTVRLTSKGKPDKREEPSWYGHSDLAYVFAHAFVQLLDDEQRSLFGDHFRDNGIRFESRLDVAVVVGATEQQIENIRVQVTQQFDAAVEEAKQLIEANAV